MTRSRLLAVMLLGGFFMLAFVFALVVSRSLQQQIGGVLSAARRLGGGDLDARVPTVGNDEFADLGREFNKMAEQLQERLAELQRERERVQSSMRRLGQAVGSNLDAEALLQLVVETAVEGVDADAGRVIVRDAEGELHEAARVGLGNGLGETVRQAEARRAEGRAAADRCGPGLRRARAPAAGPRDRRTGVRGRGGRVRRARRATVQPGGDRALSLPRRAGGGVGGERRAPRGRRAAVRHRPAHTTGEPPPVRRGAGGGGRSCDAARPAARVRAARPRRLQDRQRRVRPSAGRHRAARGLPRDAARMSRHRYPGALRRRGARGDPPGGGPRRGVRAGRAGSARRGGPAGPAARGRRCPAGDGEPRRLGGPHDGQRRSRPRGGRGRRAVPGETRWQEPV